MAQIVWTEPALRDLDEIAEYIALDKYSAAQNLVEQVFSRVAQLQEFPESGRKPPELPKNSRYYEVIVGPCRIFYRIDNKKLYVLYIMRSERQLRKFLLEDRKNNN
jgi:toxin ParE1/3/4